MSDKNSNIECYWFYRFSDMGADIHSCFLRDKLIDEVIWEDPPCINCKYYIKKKTINKMYYEYLIKQDGKENMIEYLKRKL